MITSSSNKETVECPTTRIPGPLKNIRAETGRLREIDTSPPAWDRPIGEAHRKLSGASSLGSRGIVGHGSDRR